ncbi:MAG TPA: 8-oxoguanine deaminase [Opitutus sp.]|nr:8-oxoguanine deaminase [Opitutus sp.]
MSGPLVIKHCGHLVTMDATRRVLRDGWIVVRDGFIAQIGEGAVPVVEGAEVVDARGGIVVPGLVNTHHHMYQNLARAYTPIANLPLLPWLAGLTPLWRTLTAEDLHTATLVAMAELMLTGCTTTSDHHYVFPRGSADLIDAQFAAAAQLGMRFHGARGSMDTSSDLIPDWAVQPLDAILADSERLAARYHDARRGAMTRLVLAPCALTSASVDLYRESAAIARRHGLHLHTHCAETVAENDLAAETYGERPLPFLEKIGWAGERVWFAHGIHFNDEEVAHLGRHRMGVAHCPCSNMRLGSGVCRVRDLRSAGANVGLGVDGSASNDSGHMLNEVRQALLLTRVAHGAGAMTVDEALTLATRGGAQVLGRDDIGTIEPGKCADVAIFPAGDLFSSGAENPVDALLLCFPRQVETLVVNGTVRVREGKLVGLELPALLERHGKIARRIVGEG